MRRASLKEMGSDPNFEALWHTIGRTLRLLVAMLLVTTLVVLLLHGLNVL